jgi:tetratricopeptide (TPR) repeat protein
MTMYSARSQQFVASLVCAAGLFFLGAGQNEARAADQACGNLAAAQGPYDYRTESHWVKFIEGNHFRPEVEALIRGVSGPVGAEIDFVLRHIPNHHRALLAMTRLSERQQWQRPQGAKYSVDCYYERALRFRHDDVIARLLFTAYLIKRDRRDEALAQLERATIDAGDNGFTHFNIGLQYVDLRVFDKAADAARRALGLGFTRPELIDRLRAAGQWRESPVPDQANAISDGASAPR